MKTLQTLMIVFAASMPLYVCATAPVDPQATLIIEPQVVVHESGPFSDSFDFQLDVDSLLLGEVQTFGHAFNGGLEVELLDADNSAILHYPASWSTVNIDQRLSPGSYTLIVSGISTARRVPGSYTIAAVSLPVPEPSMFHSLFLGLGVLAFARHRHSRKYGHGKKNQ